MVFQFFEEMHARSLRELRRAAPAGDPSLAVR
jgi:hypothetical protein